MTSGTVQPSCSASSSPMVFLPSIRYGSFSVEVSNQPTLALPSPTILPQSSIRPLTRYTAAPCRPISLTFTSGRVFGAKNRGLDAAAAGVSRHRRAGIAVGGHRHVFDAERLRHGNRHHQAARLERAGRQAAFVLHQQFAAARFCRELRQREERRHRFAEADDVLQTPHRQQLAIAPQVGRAICQRRFGQCLFHAGQIVADQQRLAGARQIMNFVGRVMLAGRGAFQVGDESRPFGGQVVVVAQGGSPAGAARWVMTLARSTQACGANPRYHRA